MKLSICEMVAGLSFLEYESAEITSKLIDQISSAFSPEKGLNPENYEVSIFQSSSPAQKGPLMIKVDELALNDHVSTKFSSIMPSAEIAKKIDSLQLSVFKSSTPTQQTDFVRRFEKLGLHDFFSYHFSPIWSEPEMKIEPFAAPVVKH